MWEWGSANLLLIKCWDADGAAIGHIASTSIVTSPTSRLIYMLTATICRLNFDLVQSNWRATLDFAPDELREIQSMVRDLRQRFLEAWNESFGIVGE